MTGKTKKNRTWLLPRFGGACSSNTSSSVREAPGRAKAANAACTPAMSLTGVVSAIVRIALSERPVHLRLPVALGQVMLLPRHDARAGERLDRHFAEPA
jgi:hypothetical protein